MGWCRFCSKSSSHPANMAMDQYLLIPFLVGWTSIYQLFWCSPGVQGFDTLPHWSLKMQFYEASQRQPLFHSRLACALRSGFTWSLCLFPSLFCGCSACVCLRSFSPCSVSHYSLQDWRLPSLFAEPRGCLEMYGLFPMARQCSSLLES